MEEPNSIEPTRVKNFARFFKNYMSIWSVVIAALPIPITSFNLIPVFEYQKHILSTYTTLFCFLILGYIFYSRHRIAKFFFPSYYFERQKEKYIYESVSFTESPDEESIKEMKKRQQDIIQWLSRRQGKINFKSGFVDALPFIFIVLSISSAFYYNSLIEGFLPKSDDRGNFLKNGVLPAHVSTLLMATYLGIFLFAETAFILMAIKEYLQDLLHISDNSLMIDVFDKRSVETSKQDSSYSESETKSIEGQTNF